MVVLSFLVMWFRWMSGVLLKVVVMLVWILGMRSFFVWGCCCISLGECFVSEGIVMIVGILCWNVCLIFFFLLLFVLLYSVWLMLVCLIFWWMLSCLLVM